MAAATTAKSQSEASTNTWERRITHYGELPVEELLANPLNLRVHNQQQFDTLLGILGDSVGLIQNVIFNERTGHLVDGHARVALAKKQGEYSLPVTFVDMDEETEALALATYDAIGTLAENDPKMAFKLVSRCLRSEDYMKRFVAGPYASLVANLALKYVDEKIQAQLSWTASTPVEEILEQLRTALADANDLIEEPEEDEVDDSEAFHHENSFTEKAREWSQEHGEASAFHTLQVFIDYEQKDEIIAMLEKLAAAWIIDTQTDTVLECIRRGYEHEYGDEPALDIPVLE